MLNKIFVKKIKYILFLIFLINLVIFVFADCSIDTDGVNINLEPTITDNEIIFDLETTPEHVFSNNITFNKIDCNNDYNVVIRLQNNLEFKLDSTFNNLVIDGNIDIFELNGYSIDINFNNNANILNSNFKFEIPLLRVTSNSSKINIIETQRNAILNSVPFSIDFEFNDIEVKENADFELIINSADAIDHETNGIDGSGIEKQDYIDEFKDNFLINLSKQNVIDFRNQRLACWDLDGDGSHGSNINLIGNNIFNKGDLNISLNSGKGGRGVSITNDIDKDGGLGGTGGSINIDLNSIVNFNKFNLIVDSGDAGSGGDCATEEQFSIIKPGSGGFGGFVFMNINNIINKDNLDISIVSGNGGSSGDCVFHDNYGGFGGSIFPEINTIFNEGNININLFSGKGGTGDFGGYGGHVFGMFISNIINEPNPSSGIVINILSGEKGSSIDDGIYGKPGSTGNITIENLKNSNSNFNIITKVNDNSILNINSQCCNNIFNKIEPSSGNILIKNLETGSYLPRVLKTENNNIIDLSEIIINTCYIKNNDISDLDYNSRIFYLSSVNGKDILSNFKNYYSGIIVFGDALIDCPYCEFVGYDSTYRIDYDYDLYSNINGIINIGDLNIYYAKDSNIFEISKKSSIFEDQEFLLYTNKEIINSQESEFGLYKYEFNKNILYNVNENKDFLSSDKLYCPAQHYYIKAEIEYYINNDQNSKSVEFPFTPLFSIE
jgi:hypothetical protein